MKIVIKCWRCNKLYEVSLFSYLVRCITNLLESGMWSYDLFCAEHEDNVVVIQSNIIATSERPNKEIPIVALMSSSDEKTVKRALDSGMNFHLEKSTSKTKLLSTIEDWLNKSIS